MSNHRNYQTTERIFKSFADLEIRLNRPPTIREVTDEAGLHSTSVVLYHIDYLLADRRLEVIGGPCTARRYRTRGAKVPVMVPPELIEYCKRAVEAVDDISMKAWVRQMDLVLRDLGVPVNTEA